MKLNKKTVDDINVKGKKVLVRCDFNVPLKDGKITDENRLVAALPTIKKLVADGGKVILCSHLGKPKGEPKPELSLAPVAARLEELLGQPVTFAADDNVVGDNAKAAVAAMNDGDIVLLQNTRYRAEETKNEAAFSEELGSLADVFVNDAFGTAHRAHCSTVGVVDYVDEAVSGYLIAKEIKYLGEAVEDPKRPFVTILGGAKVADKLNVIENLLTKADTLIIGGGMAYTFVKAQGGEIGKSLVDDTKLEYCRQMLLKAAENDVKIVLPLDTVIAKTFPDPIDAPIDVDVVDTDAIPADSMGLDIGPKTAEIFAKEVSEAATVVWKFDHIRFQLFVRDVLVMLCGNDDGVDVHRLVVRVFDRHLRFSVGTQISQRAVLTDLGELSRQRMRKVDRQRHQNGCFVTGIAEHHALIARTGIQRVAVDAVFAFERTVDAERDVVRLPVKRDDHAAGAAVEAELCAVITDVAHRFAHDALDVHITLGRDLAHDEHKTGRAGGFACHACVRILFQDRVKHGVADLVADLVGMTDRDRFTGKKRFSHNSSFRLTDKQKSS